MMGMLGKKMGMTQVFGESGEMIPVTVVQVGPCVVTKKRTRDREGYDAVQLGFGRQKASRLTKAYRGQFEGKNLPLCRHLKEFRLDRDLELAEGQELTVSAFKVGDTVHVRGITKGRGFQGVIKRHGMSGGPASHGSDFHRRPGSLGQNSWPSRIYKNVRLPGHMGVDAVTTRNLTVVAVRPQDHVLLIKGAIPGTRGGLVEVLNAQSDFLDRDEFKPKQKDASQPAETNRDVESAAGKAEESARPNENKE